ncbi:ATP-binding cassette sub-family G member 1 isoform X1 [Papilio machaon]|uniref:ATP-binding cassette sub-family G member 1 isoform X1 n=1 Tax=Papilio machaon TaxID=76193 RepID=UPI001E664C87|nr:ATP-binding cassette sub-family G member 1 isoform X1 [Papilio machaon]
MKVDKDSSLAGPVDTKPILSNRKGSLKVTITPAQHKTLTHLPKRPPVDLAFTDLMYRVHEGRKSNEKIILKSVSGRLRSGELTAIMGPSGAGKSTLLNILTGYKTSGMEGSITVNGMERNLSSFRKLSCYIMQDNQLHGNLTVEEAMSVATALKLPSATTRTDKDEVIREILETLGLSEHHKTMTSNLSGGQKKRLSIALELVNNPPIMFFDEPTSGLDSSSCFQCISLLKTLARGGRTIICTIHQPSARLFEMFDHLYTLADGQCVYQGSTGRLVEWLGSLGLQCPSYHNPASFIIEVSCGEYGDNTGKLVRAIDNGKHDIRNGMPFPDAKLPDFNNKKDMESSLKSAGQWNKNDLSQVQEKFSDDHKEVNGTNNLQNGLLQYAANEIAKGKAGEPIVVQMDAEKPDNVEEALLGDVASPRRYATSEWTQFWVVLKRTLLFSRRDWTLMYLRLFAHILVGFLIGALYYDIGDDGSKVLSNLGFLFFNMLFLMYTSMTITILSFPLEMPVLVKEHFNRWYSLRSYYLAITVSDIPFQAIFCVIYVVIVYLLTSQPLEWSRFALFLGSCLLISFVAQSVGLVVGAAMNVQNGVFLAPVMSVPFLLFSGFFVSFNAIPVYLRWITYLSYIRYGFEGTALATYSFNRTKLQCHQTYCHFKDPNTTLEELDMLDADITLDIAALCLIFVILRVSAFLFLRWKLRSTR